MCGHLIENAQSGEDRNYCNELRTARLVAGLWLMVFVVVYASYVYVTWWPPIASLGPNATAPKRRGGLPLHHLLPSYSPNQSIPT
ncbi:MAG: hypothetical protein V3581_00320 [Candidatus Cardinium sp.]|uniref:hypothetical protein n=1 Tax=Candidatus Cardinium sp. TP TaxID=2961955 RepID=UPI0021AFF148|nr:hypothetical protein [Candidatus Cardinium sp. TP]MCT4697291.1 hypothetical protein [Candidatus Cardinium sp. TP]MDN5247053.1 hypothetical protein [Candidatus Cardinium sp.]